MVIRTVTYTVTGMVIRTVTCTVTGMVIRTVAGTVTGMVIRTVTCMVIRTVTVRATGIAALPTGRGRVGDPGYFAHSSEKQRISICRAERVNEWSSGLVQEPDRAESRDQRPECRTAAGERTGEPPRTPRPPRW